MRANASQSRGLWSLQRRRTGRVGLGQPWIAWERQTSLVVIGLLLLCLMLLGGCAVPRPVVQPPRTCNVPQANLQPTPVPPMDDATGRDLLREANQLREALGQANADKQAVLNFIKRRCT